MHKTPEIAGVNPCGGNWQAKPITFRSRSRPGLPDLSEGVMVWMPGIEVIRDLTRENPGDEISLMSHEPDPESTSPAGSSIDPGRSP
jgi:hypothetical protein